MNRRPCKAAYILYKDAIGSMIGNAIDEVEKRSGARIFLILLMPAHCKRFARGAHPPQIGFRYVTALYGVQIPAPRLCFMVEFVHLVRHAVLIKGRDNIDPQRTGSFGECADA